MNAAGYVGISQQMTSFHPLPCADLNPNEILKMRSPKGTCLWRRIGKEAEEVGRAKTLEKRKKEGWWRRRISDCSAVLRNYWQTYWEGLKPKDFLKPQRTCLPVQETQKTQGSIPGSGRCEWNDLACTHPRATSVHLKSPCLPGKGLTNNPASFTHCHGRSKVLVPKWWCISVCSIWGHGSIMPPVARTWEAVFTATSYVMFIFSLLLNIL